MCNRGGGGRVKGWEVGRKAGGEGGRGGTAGGGMGRRGRGEGEGGGRRGGRMGLPSWYPQDDNGTAVTK
jgi:hypothetical protein